MRRVFYVSVMARTFSAMVSIATGPPLCAALPVMRLLLMTGPALLLPLPLLLPATTVLVPPPAVPPETAAASPPR